MPAVAGLSRPRAVGHRARPAVAARDRAPPCEGSRTRPTATPGSRRQASARGMGRSERERAASRRSPARIPARPTWSGFRTRNLVHRNARCSPSWASSASSACAARCDRSPPGSKLTGAARSPARRDPSADHPYGSASRTEGTSGRVCSRRLCRCEQRRREERLIHHAAGNHGTALRVMG
jgi:hypothetical protein